MTIDTDYLTTFLIGLLNTPSPTGDTEQAIAYTETALRELGLETRRTVKGALVATLEGQADDAPRAVTAHADTLGTMVKEIKPNGRLTLTQIGGYPWNAIEGEGVTIATEAHGNVSRVGAAQQGVQPRPRPGRRGDQARGGERWKCG